MASTRVVVDPITRIEGHLRIEAQADNGRISKAWASSTQFRGIEIIMQGRDPRDAWAFTQRICGVCTVVHAVASCRAVEDALDIHIPANANLIRNLIHGMQFVQDHVIHFYHLHALDWVDVVSALSANPADTAAIAKKVSPWPNNSETYFRDVQNRLKTFVSGGQLGIFTNGYWGHPAYKLPPAVNLLAVAHYLEALDWQRDVIRLHTIFGGKNPHPNYLVGGAPCSVNLDEANALNAERLAMIGRLFEQGQQFVEQVYLPDLLAVAGFYKDWAAIGGGTVAVAGKVAMMQVCPPRISLARTASVWSTTATTFPLGRSSRHSSRSPNVSSKIGIGMNPNSIVASSAFFSPGQ